MMVDSRLSGTDFFLPLMNNTMYDHYKKPLTSISFILNFNQSKIKSYTPRDTQNISQFTLSFKSHGI